MNKRILLAIFIVTFLIGIAGIALSQNSGTQQENSNQEFIQKETTFEDFTATFGIYTNGTKRIFTAAMYHNQSPDVFIQSSDPSTVQVKKQGITWGDFFSTLPFSLTKDCLVTGTGQSFCNTQSQKLRFFLNDLETPSVLDNPIKPNDDLLVNFGN